MSGGDVTHASKNAYGYEGKIINVGTPGVFHKIHYKRETNEVFLDQTFCGIVAPDLRSTDHRLADYQPCAVCFEGWGGEVVSGGDVAAREGYAIHETEGLAVEQTSHNAGDVTARDECVVCHGSGVGPGDDSVRCWFCDGRGLLRAGVPTGHGLFVDWLLRLHSERDALLAELEAAEAARAEAEEALREIEAKPYRAEEVIARLAASRKEQSE